MRRVRIIVVLSRPVSAPEYSRLWRFFADNILEVQTVDEAAKDAWRFWFVPSCPIGGESAFEARMLNGEPLDVDATLASIPIAPHTLSAPVAWEGSCAPQFDGSEPPWLARIARSTRIDRASKWVRRAESAIEKDHGSDRAIRVATALVCGFALGVDDGAAVFTREYNRHCEPAWSGPEIRHKCEDAAKAMRMPWGEKLRATESKETGTAQLESPASVVSWESLVTPVLGDWFTRKPAAREWLLRDARRSGVDGVLALGKAAELIAEGGAGKTMALIQLALAVASGGKWFDTFSVEKAGRVLMLLGEEDAEESHRRIYSASRGTTSPEPGSIVVLPLAGHPCALLERGDHGNLYATEFAAWLEGYVSKTGPWSLIVLDPLSRFAGPGAEVDNAEGTRFVQSVERLSKATGATTLVSHHTNKPSRGGGELVTSAGSRGSSSITDDFRWVASLTVQNVAQQLEEPEVRERLGEIVTLAVTKSNYSRKGDPLVLRRTAGGPLAPLDAVDREMVDRACDGSVERQAKQAEKRAERDARESERTSRAEAMRLARLAARREEQAAIEREEEQAMLEIVGARPGLFSIDLRSHMASARQGCSHARVAATIARLGDALRVESRPSNAKAFYLASSPAAGGDVTAATEPVRAPDWVPL